MNKINQDLNISLIRLVLKIAKFIEIKIITKLVEFIRIENLEKLIEASNWTKLLGVEEFVKLVKLKKLKEKEINQ